MGSGSPSPALRPAHFQSQAGAAARVGVEAHRVQALRVVDEEAGDHADGVRGDVRAARLREDVVEERDDEQALLGRVEEVAKLHTTPWLGQKTMQRRLEDAHVPAVFMPTS